MKTRNHSCSADLHGEWGVFPKNCELPFWIQNLIWIFLKVLSLPTFTRAYPHKSLVRSVDLFWSYIANRQTDK